jgi:hydrogenase maturation protein HypF
MCLGVPGQVVELLPGHEGQVASVAVHGTTRPVNVGMLDAPPPAGSWVLVHLGFAMETLEEAEAGALLHDLSTDLDPGPGPSRVADGPEHEEPRGA